ncbi:MAG: 3'-5' exonuclease [Epsilonproteobacteria bacterium]|nr:3'-5' exonuclease [Campylobacterota bacterium]
MVCVFDCETIPDLHLVKQHYSTTQIDEILLCEEVFLAQEESSGSSFLPVPFHEIVTISAVIADDYGKFTRVGTLGGVNERDIIHEFFMFIEKTKPKLISFNGRNFDLPLLMIRALKYNLSLPTYFDNSNKWDNYRSRYSENFHIDLIESFGNFGAVRGLKLDVLASMSGLPGKWDVHGDEVYKLYFDGEMKKIKEYCESDVLNTYWLWLKYEILKGNLLIEDYYEILIDMANKLDPAKSYANVFIEAIKKEIENA